jgi:hypothetical protein
MARRCVLVEICLILLLNYSKTTTTREHEAFLRLVYARASAFIIVLSPGWYGGRLVYRQVGMQADVSQSNPYCSYPIASLDTSTLRDHYMVEFPVLNKKWHFGY